MPPADPIPGTPDHWLKRARSHLALATQQKPPDVAWEDLAYHAQQAAEFVIKAVYQSRNIPFRFTHDLEALMTALEAAGIAVPPEVKNAELLTRFATLTRYPGLAQPVTSDQHEEAIRLAQAVLDWAESIIK